MATATQNGHRAEAKIAIKEPENPLHRLTAEQLEIGHNVLHGQWDWMNDPVIKSRAWDWDTASTAEAWRHSHNYIHHTYTNIVGKDRDLGY
jgi:fatty acid desaturase